MGGERTVPETSGLLSQDEVDSLLQMLADGEDLSADESMLQALESGVEVVRRYDFHQPDRFNKEHLRTLRMIHENIARRLGLQLSTKLRISVDVVLAYIETGPYASFVSQLSSAPSAMHLISMKPLPGRFLLQYDNRLADMLVDRLLGGAGMPSKNSDRELTDLEMDLLTSVTQDVMDAIQDSWQGTIELTCKLEEMMTNPYFVQVALPSDTCAWISFEMKVNGQGAALNFCIPASVLKPITPKLSPQAWIAGSGQQTDEEDWTTVRRNVRRHLDNLELELTAVLRGGEIMLSDLMALQVGDVIPLQRHISEEVVLTIQDQDKMCGHLGMHRGKVAVEITKIFTEEEE
ncbi:MAG: flagellar motor switch protein FliM [Caldilineae bacterium]|nr:MAG: flagellar motor switch protein FliM [Caldilineae bacterium]